MGKKGRPFYIFDLDGLKLFYLLIVVFISITVLSFSIYSLVDSKTPRASKVSRRLVSAKQINRLEPVLKGDSFPILSAQSVLAIDIESGKTLYEKNADSQLLPASTTKIITALVVLDGMPLDRVVTVGNLSVEGQKMGLSEGERISVEDLLYGLLVYSANDAAEVLAQNYCDERKPIMESKDLQCGREVFIKAMNEKAMQIGLKNSTFTNPSGLDGKRQFTSAGDLVKASLVAMKNPFFAQAVGVKKKTVGSVDGGIVHRLENINELLGEVEGVLGVKTGWTENARENLVTYVERDNKRIMIALLGSQDRFSETEELIEWIFENYEWEILVDN